MEEASETRSEEEGSETSQKIGKETPPPIIITTQINLLRFQGEIKAIAKGSFELRNTKNGTRVITKEMANYLAIKSQLQKKKKKKKKIPFYTFHPKSVKPIKAIIRYLPSNTPAEDIANELLALGFRVIGVRQMTPTRPQASDNLPLFLVKLPRSDKSQEIFKLTSLSHVIRVEAHRAQTDLTQCLLTASNLGTYGQTAGNPLDVYGVEAAIYTRSAQKRKTGSLHLLAATSS
jgi:hypothetical protein